jgi:hypothetical protein
LLAAALIAVGVTVAWAADAKEEKVVRHVVLFKFKDDAPADKVKAIEDAFVALKDQIDVIKDLEWGTDISPENLQQGFTHCFLLTFANVQDRDAYLPHPKHKAFGALLGPYLDKVLVVDFESK